MFPWVYEFRWTGMHIAFLGIFFGVAVTIASTVAVAVIRVLQDFKKRKNEAIQWEADFEDLSRAARVCRHELTGEVKHRTCDHEFDCRSCTTHPTLLARHDPESSEISPERLVFGFTMPLDRRYHRGHTWVKNEGGGIFTIGLDDFGTRMIGEPDGVELPKPGTQLQANGTGWSIVKQNSTLRILSPVDGEVIERGGPEKGWYLKVRANDSEAHTRHLLRGDEIRPWIMREMERLQYALTPAGAGMALADGGELMPEMWKHAPHVDWDGIWGEMFLQA